MREWLTAISEHVVVLIDAADIVETAIVPSWEDVPLRERRRGPASV